MSLFDEASLIVTPNAFKASKLYSIKPTDGSGDLSVVRATTATRVNSAGLIETVSANVPRLDYTNSTCPSILVEPQRTNLKPSSNDWTNSTFTLINVTQSQSLPQPLFGTTALQVRETTANSSHVIQIPPVAVLVIGQVYTRSFYVKPTPNRTVFNFSDAGQIANDCRVNLSTKTVISKGINVGNVFFKDQIDGIIRVEITFTATGTIGRPTINLFLNNTTNTYVGDVNEGIDLYHIQYELGANATSSIITLASTVTRNADVISKTGISSLIGQTEGTIFVDFNYTKATDVYRRIFAISDNTSNNLISINLTATGSVEIYIINGGVTQVAFVANTLTLNTTYKIAVGYIANNAVLYINGTLRNTDLSCTIPTCSGVYLGKVETAGSTAFLNDTINTAMLFKTKLTNSELATLTTP